MATISASPNPVGVYSTAVGAVTMISWDTRGAIYVSEDGGAEQGPINPANMNPGTLAYNNKIEYPKTYKFTLRRTDLSELASTLVTTFDLRQQLVEGFSSAYLPQLRPQAIKNLSVRPGVDVVLVTFKTTLPTIPLIELRDASGAKIDARFPLFGGMRTEHQAFFGEDRPLALEAKHTIRIVASGRGKEVELNAEFISGSRKAEIFFDSIDVHDDSDPGPRGSGEFFFDFGAGDADTTDPLGEPWPSFGWTEISDSGPLVKIDRKITIEKAPRRIWAQTVAIESDMTIIPTEWYVSFRSSPRFASPGSEEYNTSSYQRSVATAHIELEDTPGTPNTTPFELRTGDFDVDFVMTCRVVTDSKFGQFIAPKMHKVHPRSIASAVLTSPGDISALSATGNAAGGAIVALGPDNALYHRGVGRGDLAKRLDDDDWARVELPSSGTPTVVASGADRLDVLLLRPDGVVMHAARSSRADTHRWRDLGGNFRQLLAAAQPATSETADPTVVLFGLADDGSVHVRDAQHEGGDWARLGDQSLRAFTATTVPGVGAVLFAIGEDLILRCFLRENGRWRSLAIEGRTRGDRPPHSLAVVLVESAAGKGSEGAEQGIVVGALGDEQRVQILRWTGFPSSPLWSDWTDAGSIQDLLIDQSDEAKALAGRLKLDG